MDVFYKKIKANVTPEVLAQLHSKKIILESTNQQQTKGRYSIVIFDIYGTLTLDNDVLSVSTLKESYQITERPYHYLTTKTIIIFKIINLSHYRLYLDMLGRVALI